MPELLHRYETDALTLLYLTDDAGHCGMALYPKDQPQPDLDTLTLDPLVHLFVEGDIYSTGFCNGVSMRNSTTTRAMKLQSHTYDPDTRTMTTVLGDGTGLEAIHRCRLSREALICSVTVQNGRPVPVALDMVTTFSLNTAIRGPVDNAATVLHRLRSTWSSENRMLSQPLTAINMEESWAGTGFRSERFGSVGSLPVRQYYPFAALEYADGTTWAAILDAPYTWQLEISRMLTNELNLSGGVGDLEHGHHRKVLQPGSAYTTPDAYVTAISGTPEDALRAFNRLFQENQQYLPDSERDLPVIYNEFCYTWGNPSAEKICALADRLQGWGIDYLVIDAGWYQNESGNWENNMGDWEASARLFPEGIKPVTDHIRSCGMLPGIWFELETLGEEALAATAHRDWLLTRHGNVIQSGKRLFWNFSNPEVISYLDTRIRDFLKDNGFVYLKVDYNESVGIGCDDPESLGAGLQKNVELAQAYYHKLHAAIPELVLEICASGGHRNEPSFLKLSSMNSFSDAHECTSIPIIAANVGMTVPARQNQIWCVIRPEDTDRRIIYSLAAACIGRLCLSGDLCATEDWQQARIKEGIRFYETIKPVIRQGDQYIYRNIGPSYNNPTGSQVVVRKNEQYVLLIAHSFDAPAPVQIPLEGTYRLISQFGEDLLTLDDGSVLFHPTAPFSASAMLLERL